MKEATRALTHDSVEIKPSDSDIERFWSKVNKSGGDDACWEWMSSTNPKGYGKFWFIDDTISAHRFSWFLANGKIPRHQPFICHKCDNPKCVNPAHLFAGDSQDNISDMISKGRSLTGEKSHAAKITSEDVIEIRRLWHNSRITSRQLGEKYGLGKTSVLRIIHGKTWAHLPHHSHF